MGATAQRNAVPPKLGGARVRCYRAAAVSPVDRCRHRPVDRAVGRARRGGDLPMFVAPGLLATAAMNGAVDAASLGVFQNLRFNNVYQAMLTTPVRPRDIAFGEACWATLRGAIEATGFLLIMAARGLVRSWWGLLAIPGAILISFAFASVGLAVATAMRSLSDIQLMQLVLLPMFLFSTTFYPISVYPLPVQWLIE